MSIREFGNVVIVNAVGRITINGGAQNLRDAVRELLARGKTNIILRLAEAEHIDSTGVGELIVAFAGARNGGGRLKILSPAPKINATLGVTKLLTVIQVFDNEDEALKSFGPA
jgi:anti-sigma B factor antagonist